MLINKKAQISSFNSFLPPFRKKESNIFPSSSLPFYLPKPVLLSIKLSTNLIKLRANFLLLRSVHDVPNRSFIHPLYISSVSSTDFHELNACTFFVDGCRTSLANLRPLCSELISFIEKKAPSHSPFIRMKKKCPSLSSLYSSSSTDYQFVLATRRRDARLFFFPRRPFPYSFSPFRPATLV